MPRRPLPTEVKERSGHFKRNPQRRTSGEPTASGTPAKPSHLDQMASDEWDRITGLLAETGVLSASDEPSLEQYCVAYSAWRRALAKIEQGDETAEGKTYSAASVREAREAGDRCYRYLIEFGMTPAARTRVKASDPKTEPDWFEQALRNRAS